MLPEKEFNALLVQWTPYIRDRVNRHSPRDLADDAVQDVLTVACSRREKYDPAKGAFVTWLFWVIRSVLSDRAAYAFKRVHLDNPVETFDDGEPVVPMIATYGDPHAHCELTEALGIVNRLLKPRHATVVLQRAIGATFDEIGAELGTTGKYAEQVHKESVQLLRKRTGRKQLERRAA